MVKWQGLLFIFTSPLFDRATISLPGAFVSSAENKGPLRSYLQKATLNGRPFNRTFLTQDVIHNGDEIRFQMDSMAHKQGAAGADGCPLSPSRQATY